MIPVLVWQASVASPAGGASLSGGSKGGPAVVAGAFTRNVLLGAAASLGVFGVARGAVLLGKGEWFSDGKGGKKVQ